MFAATEQESDGATDAPLKKSRRRVRKVGAQAGSLPSDAHASESKRFSRFGISAVLLAGLMVLGAWAFGAFDRSATMPVGDLPGHSTEEAKETVAVEPPMLIEKAEPESVSKEPSPEAALSAGNEAEAARKAHLAEAIEREARRAERAKKVVERSVQEEREAKSRASRQAKRPPTEEAQLPVVSPVPQPSPPAIKAAEARAIAPIPTRKTSVEQACSHTTNFLARDLCRIDACEKASNAADPICVWYRQLDEERRRKQSQL